MLARADLTGARLEETTLTGADLHDADLTYAMLSGTNLTDAMLSGTTLTGAVLHNATLTGAEYLTRAQLDTARGDWTTKLPDDVEWPASWPRQSGEDAGG